MENDNNLLDAAAKVFRDRLNSGSRFQALLEGSSSGAAAAVPFAAMEGDIDLPCTLRLARSVKSPAPQIGDMPPEPPTMRGRLGSILVQAVRRALFWYTGQIRAFHGLVADAAREQTAVLQDLGGRQQRQQAMLTDVFPRLGEFERGYKQIQELQEGLRSEFDRKLAALEQTRIASDELDRLHRDELTARLAQIDESISAIRRALDAQGREVRLQIQHERALLQQQEFRLKLLLREVRKTSTTEPPSGAVAAITEHMHANDGLFVDHAQAFRGDRVVIKSRLMVYAPYVKDAFTKTAAAPALDLGCGRGEWLELLREMDIRASGFDWNHELVEACREMGLDARQGDIPRILGSIPDASMSVVTGFHVLEHVPFTDLLEIVDQTIRILKPGGIAIFETPNPKNMFVSTNNFYLDPTHRHPIPSELLSFLVEARGLCDPKVIALSAYPDDFRLPGSECPAVQFINDHFFGPQDYGIVAVKV